MTENKRGWSVGENPKPADLKKSRELDETMSAAEMMVATDDWRYTQTPHV